jgi:hypothetical protein
MGLAWRSISSNRRITSAMHPCLIGFPSHFVVATAQSKIYGPMDRACIRKQYGPFARQLLFLTDFEFRHIPSSSFGDEIYARACESVM